MFDHIFSFGIQRTVKQAWGFYIGHLIILVSAGLILGFISGLLGLAVSKGNYFQQGVNDGAVMATIYILVVNILLLKQKNLVANFKYILLVIATAILSLIGGGILGLIIPAVLSNKPSLAVGQPGVPLPPAGA